jgi:SNF2 family DNA or RNA helicase
MSNNLNSDVELFSYQQEAIKWMQKRETEPNSYNINGGLICLKMGLGKTLIALEHTLQSRQSNNEQFPTLIIASKTVLYEWKNQGIEKFYNKKVKALYMHKDMSTELSTMTAKDISTYDVVITTYDTILQISKKIAAHKFVCEYGQEGLHKDKVIRIVNRIRPEFKGDIIGYSNIFYIPWERVICDESQRFCNCKTYTFKAIMAIYGKYKWCLTGTPIKNKITDIWSQLCFCGFNYYSSHKEWTARNYKLYMLNKYIFESNYEKENIIMPNRIVHESTVTFTPRQKELYKTFLTEIKNMYSDFLSNAGIKYIELLALVNRLRQLSIAPYLIVSKLDIKSINTNDLQEWVNDMYGTAGIDAPKIKEIIRIIKNIPKGEKIILFSMYDESLKLVHEAINIDIPNAKVIKMNSSMNMNIRNNMLDKFKQTNDHNILLINYKIGGEGLNLTEANHIICIEPWWSPSVHEQGFSRVWRRGQTRDVHIYWVKTLNSIEIPIHQLCASKTALSNYVLYDMPTTTKTKVTLSKYELYKLFSQL